MQNKNKNRDGIKQKNISILCYLEIATKYTTSDVICVVW